MDKIFLDNYFCLGPWRWRGAVWGNRAVRGFIDPGLHHRTRSDPTSSILQIYNWQRDIGDQKVPQTGVLLILPNFEHPLYLVARTGSNSLETACPALVSVWGCV